MQKVYELLRSWWEEEEHEKAAPPGEKVKQHEDIRCTPLMNPNPCGLWTERLSSCLKSTPSEAVGGLLAFRNAGVSWHGSTTSTKMRCSFFSGSCKRRAPARSSPSRE